MQLPHIISSTESPSLSCSSIFVFPRSPVCSELREGVHIHILPFKTMSALTIIDFPFDFTILFEALS